MHTFMVQDDTSRLADVTILLSVRPSPNFIASNVLRCCNQSSSRLLVVISFVGRETGVYVFNSVKQSGDARHHSLC